VSASTAIYLAAALGLIVGAMIAAEVGRVIYNRKMDEIQEHVNAMRDERSGAPNDSSEVWDTSRSPTSGATKTTGRRRL
jgi:adenine/guanine phosphoribosyltransferase-like PRPP-binding protein